MPTGLHPPTVGIDQEDAPANAVRIGEAEMIRAIVPQNSDIRVEEFIHKMITSVAIWYS